jgi:hypothetical protein
MKKFGRLLRVSFLVTLLAVTAATISAVAQDTAPPPPDQQSAYPQSVDPGNQAPPPPQGQAGPSEQDMPPGGQPQSGDQSYPTQQAPPPPAGQPMPSTSGQQTDPPGRVAGLGYMTGSVSVQPQGTGDWVQGALNRPLTIGDNVWADKDSRAELNLGTGVMRISSETSLTLTNVTNDAVQVQLHQGTLNVHVRKLYSGEVYEIDTPNQAFTITKSGEYRFDVDPNGDTTLVTVWKGEGEATGQSPAVRVHEGQQARFSNGNSLTHQISDAPAPDGFDDWCKVRDKREDNSISARYVAPGVVGAGDLDEYGAWRQTPDYGPVWIPSTVAPGWAPYSDGQWIYQSPWGWTWVDAAPWGFAPFHYGRWVSFGGYWGWAPGPYWARPWYAPAMVAWFGGPHFGIGFGFGFGGGFGWCPLGFGEPFFPWYGAGRGYFRNVNISNTRITNINNVTNNYYNNRNAGGFYGRNGVGMPRYATTGGLTAVSRNTLEHGLSVRGNAARISPSAVRGLSSASIGRPDASPTRASVLGSKAGQPAARPSAGVTSRPTVSRMTPPASASRPTASQNVGAAHNTAPPSAGRAPEGASNSARSMPQPAGRSVPRPPQSGGSLSAGSATRSGTLGTSSPMARSVPRPPTNSMGQPTMTAHNTMPNTSSASRSYSTPYFGRSTSNNVPRPSGRIMPSPRDYSSAQNRGSYSARAYGSSSSGNYGGYRGYSQPSYGRSYAGSYGGRSYSAPSSHSSGSFGGYHGSSGSHGGSSYHGSSGVHSGGGSHGGHGR